MSFGLNLAASIVLPLQGFFNCVIYIMTSRQQIRTIFRPLWFRLRGVTPITRGASIITHPGAHASMGSPRGGVLDGLPQGATSEDLDRFFAEYDRFQRRTGSRPSTRNDRDDADDIEELEMSVGFGSPKFIPRNYSQHRLQTPRRKFSQVSEPSELERSPTGMCLEDDQASLVPSEHYNSIAELVPKHEKPSRSDE
jgi:hypothetical protein